MAAIKLRGGSFFTRPRYQQIHNELKINIMTRSNSQSNDFKSAATRAREDERGKGNRLAKRDRASKGVLNRLVSSRLRQGISSTIQH